ncbi:N-acetylglucosamine kinase [Kineococcus sp. R8]|uniref:BadF/BadG/BcrA/BcrD ATPase family protein n=1 Tax=Kineococcus siccus TaxID=2696567 RepID=UPI001412DC18|nr:N-acetylglucosamine kinase [Kineococcus siccus]
MSGPLLAVDAGGTSTRAVVLDADGTCRGTGRAGSGNPTSSGAATALASMARAARDALAAAAVAPGRVTGVVIAMAGAEGPLPSPALAAAVGYTGPAARLRRVGDLPAMYSSGTADAVGAALVCGTGSVAGRVADGELVRVVGGSGWLLGDAGSGYWTGLQVVRAVVAHLDGSGEATSLTAAVLAAEGVAAGDATRHGRPEHLHQLLDALYAAPPLALARFSPLAFAAAAGPAPDPVAARVVAQGGDALAALLRALRLQPGETLVAGGSTWRHGVAGSGAPRSPALTAALAGLRVQPAEDGLLGAAVLALRLDGPVDAVVHERVRSSLARLRGG